MSPHKTNWNKEESNIVLTFKHGNAKNITIRT